MNTKNQYRVAASLLGWLCVFGLALAIIVLGLAWLTRGSGSSLVLLVIPGAFIVYNLALGVVLRKYQRRGELFVTRSGRTIEPSGIAILGLTWGLYWRSTILQAVVTLVNSGLERFFSGGDSGALWIVQLSLTLAGTYLAALWLLRWQMGPTDISFGAVPNEKILEVKVIDENKGDAIEAVKSGTTAILTTAAVIGYFGIGLLQLAAIYGFFSDYWDWWAIPSFVAAMFVAYIPVVGAIAGVITATMVWDWDWYWAALLFFFPIVLFVFGAGVAGVAALFEGRRQ